MTVKFNQYWRMDPEKIAEYETFILKKYIPGVNRLGIHIVAGWMVLVGGYSEIILEAVANDLHLLEEALTNPKYRSLSQDLMNTIKSYKSKVLVSSGRKEAYSKEIQTEIIKFNQSWDIISKHQKAYEAFTAETFYPCLEELGIRVAGEWEVLIGDGPRMICEGRSDQADKLIEKLRGNLFQNARRELKRYVENYESRILTFHVQKTIGYKNQHYEMILV
jgi:hypothetical protein